MLMQAYGGTPPYTYNVLGESSEIQTDSEEVGFSIGPGDYFLSVSDSALCSSSAGEVSLALYACIGCTEEDACNYDPLALEDDGSCEYPPEEYLDCDGACLNDSDGDGVCDEIETPGCTWPFACNYDSFATDEDGTCFLASAFYDCNGNCSLDLNENGVCDFSEDFTDGSGFCGSGTIWDEELQTCISVEDCPSDVDDDGYVGINDLLDLLADFTTICP